MAKKGSGLTPKQKEFCRAVASGSTLSNAYREAYSAGNMNNASIGREATRMMSNPLITTHVEVLNRAKDRSVIASAVSDKDLVLNSLRHHVAKADSDSNKIRATEILGKTVPGLFKGEEPAEVERTTEEIREELNRHLADLVRTEVH